MQALRLLPIIGVVIAGVSGPAQAQSPFPPQGQQNTIPEKERSQETPTPNSGSGQNGTTGSGDTLSDKLDQSRGVIQPPSNVDPEIRVPAPDPNPGTTRVIPPPGSPGGNPTIVPK